jgi:hypothetical protein
MRCVAAVLVAAAVLLALAAIYGIIRCFTDLGDPSPLAWVIVGGVLLLGIAATAAVPVHMLRRVEWWGVGFLALWVVAVVVVDVLFIGRCLLVTDPGISS